MVVETEDKKNDKNEITQIVDENNLKPEEQKNI